jgi:hypothetical protein
MPVVFVMHQVDTNLEYVTKVKRTIALLNNYDGKYRGKLFNLCEIYLFQCFSV